MNTKKLMLATLLACALGPALAAEADQAAPQRDGVVTGPVQLRTVDGKTIINTPVLRLHGRPVKNAPYSAQEVTERQQQLADGNQIANGTTAMTYRDSEGRVRIERRDRKGELTNIMITDPVANVSWSLRPQDKTATRMPFGDAGRAAAAAGRAAAEAGRAAAEAGRAAAAAGRAGTEAGRAAAEAARARIEQMRKDGTLGKDPEGHEFIVKRVERVGRDNNGEPMKQMEENVRIIAREMTETRMRELSSLEPMLANVAGDFRWAGKGTTKSLGTRDMAGVKAEGKLRSYEIPAGEVGNKNPIVVSDESWWSPELQITVYSKHSDPRTGDNVYRLENLKREEPAAALFTVPSDYTVKDLAPPVPPKAPAAPLAPKAPVAPKANG